MTEREFVDAIRAYVLDAAVKGTLSIVTAPPGRRPEPALLALSQWFNGLSAQDRDMATRLLELASHDAVFGFLAVLDGARRVYDGGAEDEHFELKYVRDGESDVLVGEDGGFLHELL